MRIGRVRLKKLIFQLQLISDYLLLNRHISLFQVKALKVK